MAQSNKDFVLSLYQDTQNMDLRLTKILGSAHYGKAVNNLSKSNSILITDLVSCGRSLKLAKEQAVQKCQGHQTEV